MPKLTNTMHFMWNLILRGLIHSYKRRKWIFLCILTICYYSTCFEKKLNAEGVIFVPFLTTQTLFSRLTRILVSDPLLLPPTKKDLYFPDRAKTIPQIPSVKLLAFHVPGNRTRIRGYQIKLQTCSFTSGAVALNKIITT